MFVIVTLLLDVLGVGIMIPVLPRLIADFHGGDLSQGASSFGLVMAVYTLMLFVFSPVQGTLSDQLGRKPLLFVSLSGTAVCYWLLWQAPSLSWVFAAQIINGISGASMTVCSACIADVTPPQERAKSFGLIGATFGVGLILGPALGGALSAFGLHVPFIFAMVLALVDLAYGIAVLPETLAPENRRPFTWSRGNPVAALRLLTRSRSLMGLSTLLVFTMLGLQCLRATWVLYTTHRFHWSTAQNGWTFALIGVFAAALQGGGLRVFIRRFGELATLLASLALGALSYVLFGMATGNALMYVGIPLSCCANLAVPVVQGLASQEVDESEQGQLQGALAGLTTLCTTLGTLGATRVLAWSTAADASGIPEGTVFFVGAALFAVAFALALTSMPRRTQINAAS